MRRIGTILRGALAATLVLKPAFAADPGSSPGIDAALQEADRRFVAGDLDGALEILEPACAGSERPECLFSLGAIQHALGHCPEARDDYRRYREVAPRGDRIEEVAAALEEVEGRCGTAEPGAASPGAAGDGLAPAAEAPSSPAALPQLESPGAQAPVAAPRASLSSSLMLGSFALSGAAAASSVVFGVLAAQAARDCDRARRYDESFRELCEEDGPRYQGLWQGFALASASFLGIGMTLWWIDASSTATLGVSGAGSPMLKYRQQF